MKYFVLFLSRIKQYYNYRSSKAVFSIFILGSVVLNLLIIYMYGNVVNYMRTKNDNSLYYCTYRLCFVDGVSYETAAAELDDLLQDNDIKDIIFSSLVDDGKEKIRLYASKYNDAGRSSQKLEGRIYFTESEIDNKENCLIASYFHGINGKSNLHDGDTVSFGDGGDYTVVGIGTFNSGYFLPTTVFTDLHLPVNIVDVILSKRLSMGEHNRFMNLLDSSDITDSVIPAYGVFDDIRYLKNDIIGVFVLYILSIASMLFLMQYVTLINRKMDAISELVGAGRKTIACMLLSERMIISFILALLSAAIHKMLYTSVFERFNLSAIDYEFRDYCIIIAIIILSSVLASIPFAISYARRSALKTLRQ